jgi:hypothetical protein
MFMGKGLGLRLMHFNPEIVFLSLTYIIFLKLFLVSGRIISVTAVLVEMVSLQLHRL